MQRFLPAVVLATLVVTLVAATLSMLTFLRQRDLAARMVSLQQRVSAHEQAHVEQATGKSMESILKDFDDTPSAAVPPSPEPPEGRVPGAPQSAVPSGSGLPGPVTLNNRFTITFYSEKMGALDVDPATAAEAIRKAITAHPEILEDGDALGKIIVPAARGQTVLLKDIATFHKTEEDAPTTNPPAPSPSPPEKESP